MHFSKINQSKISELEKKAMSKIKGGDDEPHTCGSCSTCTEGSYEKRAVAQTTKKDHGGLTLEIDP